MPKHHAVISIGSNINPDENIKKSLKELENRFGSLKKSQFIYTRPLLYEDQPDFLNGAVLVEAELTLNELKTELKKLETRLGRVKTSNKNGPRTIDLDILLFDEKIVDEDYYKREFLQHFINELIPDFEHISNEASVLIPVYRAGDDIKIVLVLRNDKGIHGGQLAFPGGKREPEDATLWKTALRETNEEIGLTSDKIDHIEDLPVVETRTTGIIIHPFLARIQPPKSWQLSSDEISEIIVISLSELMKPELSGEGMMNFPTWPAPEKVNFYRIGNHKIWGVTYRILEPLVSRLKAGEWDI